MANPVSRRLAAVSEPLMETAIRLCGWSAILFVFAIFFFVFREAAPFLARPTAVNASSPARTVRRRKRCR